MDGTRVAGGKVRRGMIGVLLITACTGCRDGRAPAAKVIAPMQLTSEAFHPGAPLPPQFSCDGLDSSPPLDWRTPGRHPVASYTLVLEDPDAPGGLFTHWVLFNLAPALAGLPGGLSQELTLPRFGATHGRNDFGRIGYGGPCPPSGQRHRYVFRVLALDTRLALGPGASRAAVDRAMRGHIIGMGTLRGWYAR